MRRPIDFCDRSGRRRDGVGRAEVDVAQSRLLLMDLISACCAYSQAHCVVAEEEDCEAIVEQRCAVKL